MYQVSNCVKVLIMSEYIGLLDVGRISPEIGGKQIEAESPVSVTCFLT